jgi:phosphoribosylformimino-5-aminoimidazole carboxamide ribotide isomerase
MQIIPVIDLKGGVVVRGVGGRRDQYQRIVSSLVAGSAPADIARAFVEQFGARTVYIADLDAIEGRPPNLAAWRAIAESGLRLWLDAGTGSADGARRVCRWLNDAGVGGDVVVGLESLESIDELPQVIAQAGERAIFSLDLRAGQPIVRQTTARPRSALEWAHAAAKAGFQRLIVLDLTDVGTGGGTRTLDLCRAIRQELPHVELIAGGGVRNGDDLRVLALAGCSAVLVASALHDGRLTRDDWRAAEGW